MREGPASLIAAVMRRALIGACAIAAIPAVAQDALREAHEVQTGAIRAGAEVQAQIDALSDEAAELLSNYRVALQSLERAKLYNRHLQTIVEDQEREKGATSRQLERFAETERDIVPLMLRMIEGLGQFVYLDMPFQLDERRARTKELERLMDRADVTISEKYRRIMDAYKAEVDFGRSVEAYTGWLETDGPRREVDFFRVGRVLLAYQTRDRSETGFWNRTVDPPAWERLPDEYRNVIAEGLRVARKQAAPGLLKLPVPAPEPMQ